jgi:Mce-associated membrane protein
VTKPDDLEDDEAPGTQEAPLVEIDAESETAGDAQSDALQENPENPEDPEHQEHSESAASDKDNRRIDWSRVLAYGVLPGLTLLLAFVAGFAQWQESSARSEQTARTESVAAAKESAIAILSYQPDSVGKSLVAARDRLTSPYKDAYTKLTNDVVIPGAQQDHVSVTATVPAAASVSATPRHAVVTLFVDQVAAVAENAANGENAPTTTESSIRVTLEKISGRWLISGFDPI